MRTPDDFVDKGLSEGSCFYRKIIKERAGLEHFKQLSSGGLSKGRMPEKPPVTCHILDTTTGLPAADVVCSIYKLDLICTKSLNGDEEVLESSTSKPFAMARTNEDGRVAEWIFDPDAPRRKLLNDLGIMEENANLKWNKLIYGTYKIRFQVGKYYKSIGQTNFHPFIEIVFKVEDSRHYHIPLLLSNYGYTTYRGS